jgi:peroxiredoxin Q/BCP
MACALQRQSVAVFYLARVYNGGWLYRESRIRGGSENPFRRLTCPALESGQESHQERIIMATRIGNKAPAFTLKDQDGNKVCLKDFQGRKNVVLYFYPKAMTPGCTVQACGLRDSNKQLAKLDAVALGVSPDPVERLKKFADKQQLNFTLLSDEDHAIAEKYGVWGLKKFMGKEFMGIIRTTFIIDKEGRLQQVMDKVKTKSHHDDVLAILKAL